MNKAYLPLYRLLSTIFLSALTVFTAAADTASNCSNPTSKSEEVICTNFDLSIENRVLTYFYNLRIESPRGYSENGKYLDSNKTDESLIADIKGRQREWIESRDKCNGEISCLESLYKTRISALSEKIRLDGPSGSKWDAYLDSPDQRIKASTLIASFLENASRHGLSPHFEPAKSAIGDLQIVSQFGLSKESFLLPTLELKGKENSSFKDPINFSNLAEIDSIALAECLKNKSLDDFWWHGNWVYLQSAAQNECIEFLWPDMGTTNELERPYIRSKFLKKISTIESATSDDCEILSTNSDVNFCTDKTIQTLISSIKEFLKQSNSDLSESLLAESHLSWRNKAVHQLNYCNNTVGCLQEVLIERLKTLRMSAIAKGDTNKFFCHFNDSGIYVCPFGWNLDGASMCVTDSGNFYQLSKKSENKFQLSVRTNGDFLFDPEDQGFESSTLGTPAANGTYPCNLNLELSFPEWGLRWGQSSCYGGDDPTVMEEAIMTSISCDEHHEYCPQEKMTCLKIMW
ncbi:MULTISPECIES: lysozyme inhibitor LprI family protein [unclassified Marinobacterium]|uniref:lysozyme inhibitor LprI family protein n=1 Tax=unclassified Marinobacterium TaxID=2644139 RepID=UPI0015699A5E|nr:MULTISPECIES: hypothetical protein [unclassified Marinobacterium]NRP10084.1 hypothetical protein [Marinobacterium sp. xm-g-48]NRP82929.1 hypothetical protein [Marinobacterium sp. xm-d-509]